MNCPNCGNPTKPGAAFCGECGMKLVDAEAPVAPLPQVGLLPPPPPPPPAAETLLPPPPPPPAVETPALLVPPPPPPPPAPIVEEVALPPVATAPALQPLIAPAVVPAAPVAPVPPPPTVETTSNPFITVPPSFVTELPVQPILEQLPEVDIDATRVSVRRRTGSPWRLVMADGQQIVVEKTVLVGRDAGASADWPDAVLVSVSDTTNSVSKTHAAFEVDGSGLWVTDLDSTNGVLVTLADGSEFDVVPGDRVSVGAGADIELGDFVVQVEKD